MLAPLVGIDTIFHLEPRIGFALASDNAFRFDRLDSYSRQRDALVLPELNMIILEICARFAELSLI